MRLKLAILNVLAKCPGGHATLDDVRREVEIIVASGDHSQQLKRFSALGDIDIFQSGLALRDDAGLQITDAGLSLLHSLSSGEPSLKFSSAPAPQPSDNPLSTEKRSRTFDHELRTPDIDPHDNYQQSAQDKKNRTVAIEAPYVRSQIGAVDRRESTDSKVREWARRSLDLSGLIALIAAKKQFIFNIGRRYFAQRTSRASNGRSEGIRNIGGAAFAVVSLILVIACVLAAIAFGQIQSLKSDVSALRRELLPVKERVTRLEQAEKEKRDLAQQEEAKGRPDQAKDLTGGEIRSEQTTLNLSREEIQMIREYIRPAPSADTAAPAINVGDPVSGAMIPVPSQLTEKVPKLQGSRFTTRNGAIIIVKRASRQADAVLPPN